MAKQGSHAAASPQLSHGVGWGLPAAVLCSQGCDGRWFPREPCAKASLLLPAWTSRDAGPCQGCPLRGADTSMGTWSGASVGVSPLSRRAAPIWQDGCARSEGWAEECAWETTGPEIRLGRQTAISRVFALCHHPQH